MATGSNLLNQSYLDDVNTTFLTKFNELYERGGPGSWQIFTEIVNVSSKNIQIDLFGAFGATWREWIGPKVYNIVRLYEQTATLKRWEKSFYLDRMDLDYDKSGALGRKIDYFLNTISFYDKIATDVLVSNPTGYDGVALFSASHPHGPALATQSNTTTSALSFSTFESALIAGQSFQDETSEPFEVIYDTIMVGPKLQTVAFEIAGVDRKVWVKNDGTFGAQGSTSTNIVGGFAVNNVYEGKYKVIINPRLVGTYDDYWYLMSTGSGPKPIVIYQGRAPQAYKMTEMESGLRFQEDKFAWSLEADAVAVAGAWPTIYAGIL